MKRVVLAIIVVMSVFMLTSCTDNAEENLQLNEERQQFVDPGEDPTIDDSDIIFEY